MENKNIKGLVGAILLASSISSHAGQRIAPDIISTEHGIVTKCEYGKLHTPQISKDFFKFVSENYFLDNWKYKDSKEGHHIKYSLESGICASINNNLFEENEWIGFTGIITHNGNSNMLYSQIYPEILISYETEKENKKIEEKKRWISVVLIFTTLYSLGAGLLIYNVEKRRKKQQTIPK